MQTDRIFLRLGSNGALGADDLQWILYVPRRKEAPPIDATLNPRDWLPVSYVHSTKAILERCIVEKGVEFTDRGRLALQRMPPTFDEWKTAQSIRRA